MISRRSRCVSVLAAALMANAPAGAQPGVHSLTIDSHGERIHVRMYQAESDEAAPVVLVVRGFPGGTGDLLGLGSALAAKGIHVVFFVARGMYESGGTWTMATHLDDIGAAIQWLRQPETLERYRIDPLRIVLGGQSFGAGLALAYAARDTSIRSVFTTAGWDQGQLIRKYRSDETYRSELDSLLARTRSPRGPVRFDPAAAMRDLELNVMTYGSIENAEKLRDRKILLVSGWNDVNVPTEMTLKVLRSLQERGAQHVTFLTYRTDHVFTGVRDRLAEDLAAWLRSPH